jgi:hypothetical protein
VGIGRDQGLAHAGSPDRLADSAFSPPPARRFNSHPVGAAAAQAAEAVALGAARTRGDHATVPWAATRDCSEALLSLAEYGIDSRHRLRAMAPDYYRRYRRALKDMVLRFLLDPAQA